MNCLKCRNAIPEDSTFSPYCGSMLEESPEENDTAEALSALAELDEQSWNRRDEYDRVLRPYVFSDLDVPADVVRELGTESAMLPEDLSVLPDLSVYVNEYLSGELDAQLARLNATSDTVQGIAEAPGAGEARVILKPKRADSLGSAQQGFDPYSAAELQYGTQESRPGAYQIENKPRKDIRMKVLGITMAIVTVAIVTLGVVLTVNDWETEQTASKPVETPLTLPKSGDVFISGKMTTTQSSQLTIKSSTTQSCFIKLKTKEGDDIFAFFVRAGDTVTKDVPSGYYYVYFAYGKDWYGSKKLFGENTVYARDPELRDFKNYTWTYTLYPIQNGNFKQEIIDMSDF